MHSTVSLSAAPHGLQYICDSNGCLLVEGHAERLSAQGFHAAVVDFVAVTFYTVVPGMWMITLRWVRHKAMLQNMIFCDIF